MSRAFLSLFIASLVLFMTSSLSWADGPADNLPDNVRRIPKPGIEVPAPDRKLLEEGLGELKAALAVVANHPLLPDVEIYWRAVHEALTYSEFFDKREIEVAKQQLKTGLARAAELAQGTSSWTKQTGLVVRGYRSKIDRTVQPMGFIIPDDYDFQGTSRHRMDFWFHGRGETLSEVSFIQQRTSSKVPITPAQTIVLHPYGRYCNANKLAGEIDTLECLDFAKTHYRVDENRIASRGFSMGGAAAWQFAAHYPSLFYAANPGAGFAETPEFLNNFQNEKVAPPWFETAMFRMYDCNRYAWNFAHLPTVAYSGDMDRQKQAADLMEKVLKENGQTLLHIIGPMTAHKIHPDSLIIVENQLAEWAKRGRSPKPLQLTPEMLVRDGYRLVRRFETSTLRYHETYDLKLLGLGEHWKDARIEFRQKVEGMPSVFRVWTENVTSFVFSPSVKEWTSPGTTPAQWQLEFADGSPSLTVQVDGDGRAVFHVKREGNRWVTGEQTGLRKQPGLQGPIDDALMDSFIFVKPSGQCANPEIQKWVETEMEHAIVHWRQQMRGDAVVKADHEITADDLKNSNLVLWGDSSSNRLFNRLAGNGGANSGSGRLPITWNVKEIVAGDLRYPSSNHVLIAVYPNPEASNRYVVLNSGLTYREYDYLNNARQTPKLPDWAIVDVKTPANSRWPGKVVDADFFGEQWEFKRHAPVGR